MENNRQVFDTERLVPTYFRQALPVVLNLIVSLVYNLADTWFIARTGDTMLVAGVSLCGPLFMMLMAIGNIFGQGGSSLIARRLGSGDRDGVRRISAYCFYTAILCGAVIAAALLCFRQPVLSLLGADAETVPHAEAYYTVLSAGAPVCILTFIHSNLLRSEGMAVESVVGTIAGSVLNIILDPIMISVLGWGARGAAVATVLGQIVAACLGLVINLKKNPDIHLRLAEMRWRGDVFREVYAIGFPSILMQCVGSLLVFGMNQILLSFSTVATAVYGAYFKLQSFIFMPVFGLNNGMVPIIAYNYGARRPDRVRKTIRLSIYAAVGIMLVGVFLFECFPAQLLRIFDADAAMLRDGVPAFRIIATSYLFAGFCIIAGSVFQAIGNPMHSLIVSICRQMVVLLPAAYLLSLTRRLELVWLSYPIAEVMSLIVSVYFLRKTLRAMHEQFEDSPL